jgi:sulfhydrogenase subunit delta
VTRPVVLARPDRIPTLAVWKFASCDGCQLSLLDCEDELLAVAAGLDIASFPEASSAIVDGPYDLSLVEGSITTPGDARRIREIREQSKTVVTIGACATGGGIQALRNGADIDEFVAIVYAHPEYISTLATSTPIADHVDVDFELRGCPIDRGQLIEVVTAYLNGRPPRIASTSVCTECKARNVVCVMVADRAPCLGPVTHSGCGALCPSVRRGCYGCFGPAETAETATLDRQFVELGLGPRERQRLWRGFSGWSPEFRAAADNAGDHSNDAERSAAP